MGEKKLNKKIFERVNKELRLAFFGQLFLCYTDRILFLCDELTKVMLGENLYNVNTLSQNTDSQNRNNAEESNDKNRIVPSLTLKSFLDDKRKALEEANGDAKLPLFYTSPKNQRNSYTMPSFMKQNKYQRNYYTPTDSTSPHISVNYLLKKMSKLIQLQKQYNLVTYSIDDLTIFTKKEYEFILLSSIKNDKNLSKLNVLLLE